MVGNIPNLLTLTRILLLPFFAASIIYKEYHYALIIFIAASVTDLLDGLVARLTGQITDFGKILDPVADKFFLITAFVLMSNFGLMPKWIAIVVISKDLIVVTGCIILYFVTNNLKIEPLFLGKLASTLQFVLIGFVILSYNINNGFEITMPYYVVVAVITVLSGVHYVYRGLLIANSETS